MTDRAELYLKVTRKTLGVIEQSNAKVQVGGCCGQTTSDTSEIGNAAPVAASDCGCEPGKPAPSVINAEGIAVSACCGKPVSADKNSTSCCG